jgi:hypothetical protein
MTATTTTLSGPRTARRGPALWAGLALFLGGAIGASVATVVSDSDDVASQVSTSVDSSFRSASAAEAQRYVDSLEERAGSIGVTEHGYAYAHGASFAPQRSHVSADAAEHRAESEASTVGRAHPSPASIEHRAEAQAQAQAEAQASSLDSCHGATHGVC